jgi:hypothetical protein
MFALIAPTSYFRWRCVLYEARSYSLQESNWVFQRHTLIILNAVGTPFTDCYTTPILARDLVCTFRQSAGEMEKFLMAAFQKVWKLFS